MSAGNIDVAHNQLSVGLIEEAGPARSVVEQEAHRVEELLANEPRDLNPEGRDVADGNTLLDQSREIIRNNTIEGVDDLTVDAQLKLRSEDCMLPPLFQNLHRRAEEESGREIPFLKWMTDHATDEQLTNVWQWHDTYLHDLDSDPAFQERVQAIKATYAEGIQQAIAAGSLHPAMAVDEANLENARIVHGSPFSPILATSFAYAQRETGLVQMREGVSDFNLCHELTHLQKGGFFKELDEGMTDLIAAEVYNRAHPENEPIDPHERVYADQVAALESINRLSGNQLSLYKASQFYAGSDTKINTLQFLAQANMTIGLPILVPIWQLSRGIQGNMQAYNRSDRYLWADWFMRQQTAIFESAMLDAQGNKVAQTTQEVTERLISPDIAEKYDRELVAASLVVMASTHNQLNES